MPDINNLDQFTNSNIRESRSVDGKLNFLSGKNKIKRKSVDLQNMSRVKSTFKMNNVLIRIHISVIRNISKTPIRLRRHN